MATEVPTAADGPAAGHMARLMEQFGDCQPPDTRLADGIPTAIVPPTGYSTWAGFSVTTPTCATPFWPN